MSTFGPPVVLDGPLPIRPRHTLLSVAQEITSILDAAGNVVDRWGNGAQLYPYPAGPLLGFDPCSEGTFRVKEDGDEVPLPTFKAFTAYLPIQCTAGGIGDDSEFRSRAVAAFDAQIHLALERQLMSGIYFGSDPNPFLADANADVIAGGAVGAVQALAALEDAVAASYGSEPVIHATPAIATLWASDGLLEDERGMLRAVATGTPVVVGRGYVNADGFSAEPVGGAAASASQGWAFASSPILYKLGEVNINPPTIREALDRATNDVVYRAERDVLVAWDTILQTAILVDLTP